MRKVYTPPSTAVSLPTIIVGAILVTVAIFLVLPLTQLISSGLKPPVMELTSVEAAAPPPPEVMEAEPPPPPEPEEVEPQPELMEQTQQLSLADLDVDLGMGGRTGLLKGLTGFAEATDGLSDTDLFDMGDLDKAPTRVSSPSPRYPNELKKQRVTGNVVLVFIVNEQGRVENPRVESSTNPAFEEPALAAVRKWRYRPGERNGEPVSAPVRQPLEFKF